MTGQLMSKRKPGQPHKGRRPITLAGAEGRFEIGERMVDDPLEVGQKLAVTVNVRESSIDHMHSRGRIGEAQKLAGDRFRRLWEKAAVGRNQAMDTTKEPVDGGGAGDPISDDLIRATQELSRIMRAIGPVGSQLMIALVGEGRRVEDVAQGWSRTGGVVKGERAEGYVTGRMVEALNDLVGFWKLEGSPLIQNESAHYLRNGKPVAVRDDIRSSADSWTGPVVELSVGRFGDIVESSRRPLDRAALTPHVSGNIK